MSLVWFQDNESYSSKVPARLWRHVISPSLERSQSGQNQWVRIGTTHNSIRRRSQSSQHYSFPKKLNRTLRPTDHGAFGFGCGVRTPGNFPRSNNGYFAECLPGEVFEKTEIFRHLRWQHEHFLLTSKYLPDRVPLPDKGKPVVRRGRKATDQISDLTAGLPEED